MDEAQEAKETLENLQRHDRKMRAKLGQSKIFLQSICIIYTIIGKLLYKVTFIYYIIIDD